jgi:lipoprotein-releasing system ATP-binding protein
MNSLLEVQGLSKSYKSGEQRLEVLCGIDLNVSAGEMVAVTGASGSGKSTLLHLLGVMDRPDSGVLRIDGSDAASLAGPGLAAFRNRTLGFVFQFHYLLPEFTALENAMMPLLVRGVRRAEAERRAAGLLAEVGLAPRGHHRPGELSGGEQQRVALARALVGEPRLLLADEPTGNLDPVTGDAVGALLRRLHASHGLTSVVVTHNERLSRLCDRVHRLENGRLL